MGLGQAMAFAMKRKFTIKDPSSFMYIVIYLRVFVIVVLFLQQCQRNWDKQHNKGNYFSALSIPLSKFLFTHYKWHAIFFWCFTSFPAHPIGLLKCLLQVIYIFKPFLSALLLCIYNTFIHVVTYNTYLIGEKPVDEFVENTNFFMCI